MSRIIKNTVTIIGVSLTAFILGMALFEFLPFFAQEIIHSAISKNNLPISLKVRDIGLWSSDFSEIAVGAKEPFASVDSIRLDYSPNSLWHKKLTKISLSGLELNLQVQDGKLVLPWQPAQGLQTAKTAATGITNYQLEQLHNLGEINMDRAAINISFEKGKFSIPCSVNVQFSNANPRRLILRAIMMLRDQPINTTAEIDLDTMEVKSNLEANSLDLVRFADLMTSNANLTAAGLLRIESTINLGLQPLSLLSAEVSGKVEQADISFGNLRLTTIESPENQQPFLFNLTAEKSSGRFTSTSLAMTGLIEAEVGGFELAFSKTEKGITADGSFSTNIPKQTTASALAIEPLTVTTNVYGESGNDGSWQLHVSPLNKPALGLSLENLTLSANLTDYDLSASGKADSTSLKYSVKLSTLTVDADNFFIQLPELSASGKTIDGASSFVFPFNNLVFTNHGDFSTATEGEIHFNWPYQPNTQNSTISINTIQFADLDLGSLNLSLKQEQLGFKIAGHHKNSLIDTLCFDLTGYADFLSVKPEADIQFQNACNNSIKSLNLGKFSPKLAGFYTDAELHIGGKLGYKGGKPSGKINSTISNIRMTSAEKDFTLDGGSLDLHFSELPTIKTSPKQKFSFQSLKFGKITAGNGLVDFQVESPESIFIEKSQFQWSDGHVYTPAMRFSPKIKDYDLIFFCDRLHFAKLLEQLGVATSEGQGRVNGRVPVRITDGKFFLENGFLYSTPGEGGRIKLSQTDILTDNIPKNTPQFAQIDLAREALKDFAYDWTTLDINSESAEDLLLHLQINGRPSNPLPFVYNQEFGGFARVDASNPGSHFQGIKLDVNFRLPLNQVLHYGDSMKSLMK